MIIDTAKCLKKYFLLISEIQKPCYTPLISFPLTKSHVLEDHRCQRFNDFPEPIIVTFKYRTINGMVSTGSFSASLVM